MPIMQRSACALLSGLCLAGVSAFAQVGTINSIFLQERLYNDIPTSTLTTVNNYPLLVSFNEVGVSAPSGFANRDVWRFSNNGTSAYAFGNDDFFQVSMTLSLTGSPVSPRKEAGFVLSTIGGDGQFIVNTDGHEVVAFGGPLPFYAFPATFDSGETITLGMTYFRNSGDNKRYIIYSADGVNSPALEFTNLEQGIIDGSTLGGYLQIVNDPNNLQNSGLAVFQNIAIVPEPSAIGLLVLGAFAWAWRRK
jgi:hypothetical protein